MTRIYGYIHFNLNFKYYDDSREMLLNNGHLYANRKCYINQIIVIALLTLYGLGTVIQFYY